MGLKTRNLCCQRRTSEPLLEQLLQYAGVTAMRITRPIRVDAGETKYLSQRLDKAHLISLVGLSESAVDVKHHEFHGKRMSPNETELSHRWRGRAWQTSRAVS